MIDARTRLLAILGSVLLLGFIIDLVRRRKLKEEYSVLWVLTGVVVLVLAAWLELLETISDAIGAVALSSTIFFFALLFIFLLVLHFSVRISMLERRLTALIQEVALQRPRRPTSALATSAAAPGPGPVDAPRAPGARVVVVVPCFEDGPLALEAVASIEEDEPVEVVVVDDGSRGAETLAALSLLEQRGARVVRQPNGGPSVARTSGLEASTAPYVFALDSDDLLVPGALGVMVATLEAEASASFCWGDYELFGEASGRYRAPATWLPWTVTYVNPYPVASLFRREALERAGGWAGDRTPSAVSINGYEDWDLWLRCVGLRLGGVSAEQVVYRRRLHGDGRLLTGARLRHGEMYAELQRRNAGVFAARRRLLAEERPAAWKRAMYPVLFGPRAVVPLRVEAMMQRTMLRLGTGLPG